MFEQMDISESIYEGVLEPSYKKPTREDTNSAGKSRQNRGESASSQTHSEMGESTGRSIKRYVDRPSGESKTCLIHGLDNSSDECKVLGYFGAKYTVGKPTEDHINNPVPGKKFNRHQENNSIMGWMKLYYTKHKK